MGPDTRIFVAGHRGLLGSALVRELQARGCRGLITVDRSELDLREAAKTLDFLQQTRPEVVILCAALVGGIHANMERPAEFIYDNLAIQNSVIHGAYQAGVETLVFPGSNCMYPKQASQPFKETELGSGCFEPTNEPYGVAKLAGVSLCRAYARQYGVRFYSVILASLYGPNDNFESAQSHVLPALLVRFLRAKKYSEKSMTLWGSGRPRREFMFACDAARAILLTLDKYEGTDPINAGIGEDVSIRELSQLIQELVGSSCEICFDHSKPDGMAQRLMDNSRISSLGFKSQVSLKEGIRMTLDWLCSKEAVRRVPEDLL